MTFKTDVVDIPEGVEVLEYLDALEPFEIFSGRGLLGPRDWALLLGDEEDRWTII